MALEMLNNGKLAMNAIKLLGEMGDTRRAIKLAGAFERINRGPQANLLAGDACRLAGRYDEAVRLYRKVVNARNVKNEDYRKRMVARARDSITAIEVFERIDVSKIADGKYRSSSVGFVGPVDVEVEVAAGRIVAVRVTKHREKQFYAALEDTPGKIVAKQSVKGIDATSGATITSQAIVNATAKALADGAK